MSAALVPIDLSALETRVCAAPSCPRDATRGSDRCSVHAGELAALAERANNEHAAAGHNLSESIRHGIRCGEALLAAHTLIKNLPTVTWGEWLAANVGLSSRYAYGYMRLAVHHDTLPPEAFQPYLDSRGRRRDSSVSRVIEMTAHLPAVADKNAHWRLPESKRDEIRRLNADGLTYAEISRRAGVHHVTVARVLNPDLDRRKRASTNRKKRAASAAARARADAVLEQRLAAALASRPELAEVYRAARNLVDDLAADPALKKPHRYAKAARNALVDVLLADAPASNDDLPGGP